MTNCSAPFNAGSTLWHALQSHLMRLGTRCIDQLLNPHDEYCIHVYLPPRRLWEGSVAARESSAASLREGFKNTKVWQHGFTKEHLQFLVAKGVIYRPHNNVRQLGGTQIPSQ